MTQRPASTQHVLVLPEGVVGLKAFCFCAPMSFLLCEKMGDLQLPDEDRIVEVAG